MNIHVRNIPAAGIVLAVSNELPWAVEAAKGALERKLVSLNGSLRFDPPLHDSGTLEVSIDVGARHEGTCDRCGQDLVNAVHFDSKLVYLPVSNGDEAEVVLRAEELDVGWYDDGAIAAEAVLGEALALALQARILCEDEVGCTARLKAMLGDETPAASTSPFAVLADLD
jgi:uncharacterized metal-binding protein YceD (DUF177 family)